MELVEHLEHNLVVLVAISKFALEAISVICVLVGLFQTLRLVLKLKRRYRHRDLLPFNYQVRMRFGIWLALALEFQLGADILATTVERSLEALGNLAVIALIRTFLNYFLNKELEMEAELAHEAEAAISEVAE